MKRHELVVGKGEGFTLIEVLVAFSILSLTLAALFSLLSSGARSTRVADEYDDAVVWAESKLAELGVSEPLRVGTTRGYFDKRFQWVLQVSKRPSRQIALSLDNEWDLLDIVLRVQWQSIGTERELSLSTMRLVARE